uniref:cGMP-dependent protein kinase n=1 Tax=Alexandrium monilatum TaxID=311494 RepID=A0A7S4QWI1_9DINO
MGCSLGSVAKTSERPLGSRKLDEEVNEEYKAIMHFLSNVPLFTRLPPDQHPILASACASRSFEAGRVIIRQGDDGHEFFVIRSGEAEVLVSDPGGRSPEQVATLKACDFFGEQALLRNQPRTATVRAKTAISTLRITREKFQELRLHDRLQFHGRKAVAAGTGKHNTKIRPSPAKSRKAKQFIGEALQANNNLQAIVQLTEPGIQELADAAWMEFVPEGREVIMEGDQEAEYFYIVQQGTFKVLQEAAPGQSAEMAVSRSKSSGSNSRQVATIGVGGSFGELALLYAAPRSATVQAAEDSQVWVIDRNDFKCAISKGADRKIEEYVRYLHRCSLLGPLSQSAMIAVAKAMVEVRFQKDEVIMTQGDPGDTFYVMYEGEVAVIVNGEEQARLLASPSQKTSQPFGERALLKNEPRGATIRVVSGTAMALALDRESFNLLLGPLEDIFERKSRSSCCCLPPWSRPRCCRSGRDVPVASRDSIAKRLGVASPRTHGKRGVRRKDLRRVGLLGCGGFGTVELYEHRDTGASYAMKSLSKGYIVKQGMQESVLTEKFILQMTNSSFLIALHETYNSDQHLCFLLEPALGGELHATYNRRALHGSEKHAKYYIAGVVLAFEHLHERRIIYRDLKPENLMLNDKGHLKVTDMGLSKFVIGKTYTTCGTPDYFAPEMIASTGHTVAVDWWTLGILLFELMTGHPPFEADTHMQVFAKVMKGINKVRFPRDVQGPLQELVKGVLQQEPSMRLPMQKGGVDNLKAHLWFNGFDWKALESMTMQPPYLPVVKSRTDLANFHVSRDALPPQVQYKDDGSGWDKGFASSA